ncbi:hypothetical protein [Massilia sp. Root351]|uniref:hypothetical protein n=1 Tax=Massilia sp. Root351 TaxID=1736522 RepID=UPI000AFBB59C|nr:hypothetical protein [Massilia sp. Root351]
MAVLIESTYDIQWVVDLDVAAIVASVRDAIRASRLPGATGAAVFFLGEQHNTPYDIERRRLVMAQLLGEEGLMVVLERGMPLPGLAVPDNVVQEKPLETTRFSSGSDARNTDIVGDIGARAAGYKVYLFCYGQEHQARLKELMVSAPVQAVFRSWPAVRWTSVPPALDVVAALPAHARAGNVPAMMQPIGYVARNDRDDVVAMRLLAKGIVKYPFNLQVYRRSVMKSMGQVNVWAIYLVADPDAIRNQGWLIADGELDLHLRVDARQIYWCKAVNLNA